MQAHPLDHQLVVERIAAEGDSYRERLHNGSRT
jgi:hypothetical protein